MYDYVAGKKDWVRHGADRTSHAPTCRINEQLQDVRARLRDSGWDTSVVVNEAWVVLGRLGRSALSREDPVTVEEAMTDGPRTYRPGIGADALSTDLKLRDESDAARMQPAPDATEIDTTSLEVEDVVDRIEALVRERSAAA